MNVLLRTRDAEVDMTACFWMLLHSSLKTLRRASCQSIQQTGEHVVECVSGAVRKSSLRFGYTLPTNKNAQQIAPLASYGRV